MKTPYTHTMLFLLRNIIGAIVALSLGVLPSRAEITERPAVQGDAFRIVTANIRALKGLSEITNDPNDPRSWHGKRDTICRDVLLAQKAQIYAFQEFRHGDTPETDQLDYLLRAMPGFDWFTLRNAYWGNMIFYSTERFEFLGGDGFWLSDQPKKDNSMSWNATANRFVNWVKLRDKKTNHAFLLWNTHLDAQTRYPREMQIKVILDAAGRQPDTVPQLLTGDLNASFGEAASEEGDGICAIDHVLNAGWIDTYEATHPGDFNPHRTAHSFMGSIASGRKIDWVFARGPLKTVRSEIILDYKDENGTKRYPSDHFFVSADVEFDTDRTITDPVFTPVKYGELSEPVGLATDTAGSLYVADERRCIITRISSPASGTAQPVAFAGMGAPGFLDSDRGSLALFTQPRSLVVQDGIIYVADSGNKVLRVIDASTTAVARYAGSYFMGAGSAVDGTLDTARFALPAAVAIAPDGVIYVADSDAHAIRKIAIDGAVTTFAGVLGSMGTSDGTGSQARFNEPLALAIDAIGQNLYVADSGNHTVRKIVISTTNVTTIAGLAGTPGWSDGAGASVRFNSPSALTVVGNTVYVADTANHIIRAVDPATGTVTHIAGTPQKETPLGFATVIDGAPDEVLFSYPSGLAADAAGNLYVADTGNGTIRYINFASGTKTSTPLAVSGPEAGTGGGDNAAGQIIDGGDNGGGLSGPTGPSHGGGGALSHWFLLAAVSLFAMKTGKKSRGVSIYK